MRRARIFESKACSCCATAAPKRKLRKRGESTRELCDPCADASLKADPLQDELYDLVYPW